VAVTAGLLNGGANIDLTPYLSQQAHSDRGDNSSFLWMPFDSASQSITARPTQWVTYRFCLKNDLPIKSSFVLCLDGYFIEGFSAWSRDMPTGMASPLSPGNLPSGLAQTAVRIGVPAQGLIWVEYRMRGRVSHHLTALRQYYVNHYVESSVGRTWMLAYLSASGMLLVVVFGLTLVAFNRSYYFLTAYAIAISLFALFYSGYMTPYFSSLLMLNDETMSVVVAQITFLMGAGLAGGRGLWLC
jgi:hypothetical protein